MDKIGNWIPQIFYDLIGRIIPGGLLLIIAFVIFQGPLVFNASASILVLAFLTVAFVLGALLGGSYTKKTKSQRTKNAPNQ